MLHSFWATLYTLTYTLITHNGVQTSFAHGIACGIYWFWNFLTSSFEKDKRKVWDSYAIKMIPRKLHNPLQCSITVLITSDGELSTKLLMIKSVLLLLLLYYHLLLLLLSLLLLSSSLLLLLLLLLWSWLSSFYSITLSFLCLSGTDWGEDLCLAKLNVPRTPKNYAKKMTEK